MKPSKPGKVVSLADRRKVNRDAEREATYQADVLQGFGEERLTYAQALDAFKVAVTQLVGLSAAMDHNVLVEMDRYGQRGSERHKAQKLAVEQLTALENGFDDILIDTLRELDHAFRQYRNALGRRRNQDRA